LKKLRKKIDFFSKNYEKNLTFFLKKIQKIRQKFSENLPDHGDFVLFYLAAENFYLKTLTVISQASVFRQKTELSKKFI